MLLRLAIALMCCRVAAASLFTWPLDVATNGPYTLLSSVTNATVFTPSGAAVTENDVTTHRYNHHTSIAYWDNKVFIAFSSGATNEQDPGQQVCMAFSSDDGDSWSAPVQIVPSQSTWSGDGPNVDGSRIAYPRNFQVLSNQLYLVSAVDQIKMVDGTSLHYIGILLAGRQVNSDGSVGALFRVSSAEYSTLDGKEYISYDSSLGPPLMSYSKLFGVWGGSTASETPQSEWVGWIYTNSTSFDEPNTTYADAGSVNMYRLWRADSPTKYIYQSESSNGGATWTAPAVTTVPNNPSDMAIRRLSDGSFVIIGNPVNRVGYARDPLFIAKTPVASTTITNVSAIRQDITTDPVYPGVAKGGGAAYPSIVQAGSSLFVSYSIHKESIGFSKFPVQLNLSSEASSIKGALIYGAKF